MTVNQKLFRGDAFAVSLEMLSTGNAVLDLTGYTVSVALRWEPCQSVTITSDTTDVIVDATAGTIDGNFDEEDTKCLPSESKLYVVLETTDGAKETHFIGRVKAESCNSSAETCCG